MVVDRVRIDKTDRTTKEAEDSRTREIEREGMKA